MSVVAAINVVYLASIVSKLRISQPNNQAGLQQLLVKKKKKAHCLPSVYIAVYPCAWDHGEDFDDT